MRVVKVIEKVQMLKVAMIFARGVRENGNVMKTIKKHVNNRDEVAARNAEVQDRDVHRKEDGNMEKALKKIEAEVQIVSVKVIANVIAEW